LDVRVKHLKDKNVIKEKEDDPVEGEGQLISEDCPFVGLIGLV
jgi:hypothetical protein